MFDRDDCAPVRLGHIIAVWLAAFHEKGYESDVARNFEAAEVVEFSDITPLKGMIDDRAVFRERIALSDDKRICLWRDAVADEQGNRKVRH